MSGGVLVMPQSGSHESYMQAIFGQATEQGQPTKLFNN